MRIDRAFTEFISNTERYKSNLEDCMLDIEEDAIKVFEETLDRYRLGDYLVNTMDDFSLYSIVQNQDEILRSKGINYLSLLAKAYYKLAYNVGQEVTVFFSKSVNHIGKSYAYAMGFDRWLTAWGVFHVLRDKEGQNIMMTITQDAIKRSEMPWGQLDLNVLNMVTSIYDSDANHEELFLTAMKSTDIKSGHFSKNQAAEEYTLYIYEPLIRVYYALLRRDEQDFNTQLRDALELHKKYWGSEDNSRNNRSRGWISWNILGPVCIAYDSGMNIDVESDYIPEWLIKGRFATV